MPHRNQRRAILAAAAAVVSTIALLAGAVPGAAAATSATGVVTTGGVPLNVRRGPSATSAKAGTLAQGSTVTISCQQPGTRVTGTVRTTSLWDRLPNSTYVSDGYVLHSTAPIRACGAPAPATATVGPSWVLPVRAPIVSGFRTPSRPTHDGLDLGAPRNTAIHAASNGVVVTVRCNTNDNDCDHDGFIGAGGCGWYVEIQHVGDVVTRYCHMVRRPLVTLGQSVASNQVIGYVGTSGNSSGPHLHFEVHVHAAPAVHANAINPLSFLHSVGLTII
jgi:murein DD-endopeptidase MepM/ murein hydrolase activator NlpD